MEVTIRGRLAYVNLGRLVFAWIDPSDRNKLVSACPPGWQPYDDEGFTVGLHKSFDPAEYISKDAKLVVRIQKYRFKTKGLSPAKDSANSKPGVNSKPKANSKPQVITGSRLILLDISTL
jgi:hypothetical protein